jgi:hypothetical protein
MSENNVVMSETSLTTSSDRDKNNKHKPMADYPPLDNETTREAVADLNNSDFVTKFPKVERRFLDPPLMDQKISLFSFVPAKGATPNSDGIFGMAKIRGCFPTELEANERSEFLIRNVDSYHKVFHVPVGWPFPITLSSDYSKEVIDIDLQKAVSETYSHDVKQKREKEQKEIEEIKNKEKALLEDVKREKEDPGDHYTTLRVKKAQLTWTYAETEKKMKQMCGLLAKARREIEELDAEHPELKEIYFEKYMEARRSAGLNTANMDAIRNDDSFMKYLVEDLALPAVDAEYERIYGK